MEFQNVPAIVTGGASGLGEGAARALAAAGCKVAILDVNKEQGEKVAAELGGAAVWGEGRGEVHQPRAPGR